MDNLNDADKHNVADTQIRCDTVSSDVWIDNKGRKIDICTMSDRWLNNIRKKFQGTEKVKSILSEIKRRKLKKKKL